MKLFKVYVKKCDWDEYDSCVILAENKKAIENMFVHTDDTFYPTTFIKIKPTDNDLDCVRFNDDQGKIYIKEIKLDKAEPQILCASYNAG